MAAAEELPRTSDQEGGDAGGEAVKGMLHARCTHKRQDGCSTAVYTFIRFVPLLQRVRIATSAPTDIMANRLLLGREVDARNL